MAMLTNDALDVQLAGIIARGVTVHLYVNNHEPSRNDMRASFTEPTDPTYRALKIPASSWSVTGTVATSPQQRFRFTSRIGPVVGYFLTAGDVVIASERIFDAAGLVPQVRPGEDVGITVVLRIAPLP